MFILQQTVAPVGGPPRVLGDDQRGDGQTTNTGRVFQHQAGGAQPAAPLHPPPIGQGPPAGPRAGDGFVPAVGAPGQNQDPNALAVINLLKSILRAVGPDGTYTQDGAQISVQTILNDPANRAYIGELNSVIEIANRQRADLQDRILNRMIVVHDEINAGTHDARVEATIRKLAGDPQNGVQPQYGLRPNQEDPRFLDLIDANGQLVFGKVFQGTMQDIQNDPSKIQLLARTIILKEEELTVISNFEQETTRRTGEAPLLSIADLRQIRQNVNNDQRIKDRNLRIPDGGGFSMTDEQASKAVWSSIEYLAIASQYGRLAQVGAAGGRLTLLGRLARYIPGIARLQDSGRLAFVGRWASRMPLLGRLSTAGTWLAARPFGIGLACKGIGRALPVLGAGYACVDTGLNGINAINAFANGNSAEGWDQVARFAIKGGCMAAFCLIPGIGPLLGMTLGHLVGQGLEWLIMDGGFTKICDGISAGFKWLGEKLPAITKPLEIIAKPFVALGRGIGKLFGWC